MKPTLFVDIDGVVADSVPHWLSLYNKDHGTNWIKTDITEYDVRKVLEYPFHPYYNNYQGVLPVDGAIESLHLLSSRYRVVYATSGYGREWLSWHISFEDDDFVFIKDKGLLKGFGMVEDNVQQLEKFDGHGFLIVQPWTVNKGYNAVTWKAITDFLMS